MTDPSLRRHERERLQRLLRDLRRRRGLRQADVAAALGRPQSFVSKYESGERRLDLVDLARLSPVLGLELDELVAAFDGGRPADDLPPPDRDRPATE